MANKTIDALIFCPFYICESKMSITCEGLIGSKTVTQFNCENEIKEHEYNFCCTKHCRGCLLYSAIMENYAAAAPRAPVIRH